MTDEHFQDGLRLPTNDHPSLPPDLAEWMKTELLRIQEQMYQMGKIDAIKAVEQLFLITHESFFTKENLLAVIKNTLSQLENGKC